MADDDLSATRTAGYKLGDKKTVEEYQNLGKSALTLRSISLQN